MMEKTNIKSLSHLKELINSIPDDAQIHFQCSDDKGNFYNWPMYMGSVFGHSDNNNIVIQICKPECCGRCVDGLDECINDK